MPLIFRGKRPIRELRLLITRQEQDITERPAVDAALGRVVGAVGLLKEVDEVVDSGIKYLQIGAKIKTEDTGVAEESVLGLLRVF